MVEKIDVPGTDQDLDFTDPISGVQSFIMIAVGFAVLFLMLTVGQGLADRVQTTAGEVLGLNDAQDESEDNTLMGIEF